MGRSSKRRGEHYSSLSDEYASMSAANESENIIEDDTVEESKKDMVRVSIKNLNIRKGPGKEYDRTGEFTGEGIFELSERENGYGKLLTGEGWICLDFCEDI